VLTTPLRKKRMLRSTHVEMLPLETKQSGDKLLPHSDLGRGGGGFLEEVSRSRKENTQIQNFMEISPVEAELSHTDGRTDGRTGRPTDRHDEVNSRLSQFCKDA
jgi:hypothetical protein